MVPLFDDLTIFKDQNFVCFLNSRQTVGNDKACSTLHEGLHGFLNQEFQTSINSRKSYPCINI